jgi:hypothetical protein
MVAEEVFVTFYNFNPIWVKRASIRAKKVILRYFIKLSGAGARAERNNFGSVTVVFLGLPDHAK